MLDLAECFFIFMHFAIVYLVLKITKRKMILQLKEKITMFKNEILD